jgi:hypothetical protein
VKLLLIGSLAGLVIGVVLTILYFSLATFFAVNAKALNTIEKGAHYFTENAEDVTAVIDRRKGGDRRKTG